MADCDDFVDVHCHLLPGVDDGPKSLDESLALAEALLADGVSTVVVTPHQLGRWRANLGPEVRRRTTSLQAELRRAGLPLTIHAGGDVRIEPQLTTLLRRGDVVSLADRKKHVLLELPHELFFSFDVLLASLKAEGVVGVLSHPERNTPIQRQPSLLEPLVQAGCLLQITAGSLVGSFGSEAQRTAEDLLDRGWVQIVSTDAHDCTRRPPMMTAAYERIASLFDDETAWELCSANPARIVSGERVAMRKPLKRKSGSASGRSWLGWAAAAFTGRAS